jgi:hypothetical protein
MNDAESQLRIGECWRPAADEGQAEASERGEEHERVAGCVGGAGPSGFRHLIGGSWFVLKE